MKARPFTAENAAEMALRAQAARKRNKEAAAAALAAARQALDDIPATAFEDKRTQRVLAQIDRVDDMLLECEPDQFPALTAAKERLWNLVFPKAGVLKPANAPRRRQSTSLPEPEPPK